MNEFHDNINDFLSSKATVILICITKIEGSAPRDPGTFMLVNKHGSFGTIGGGTLEYNAVNSARKFIKQRNLTVSFHKFKLGPTLGQCCGGTVELSFEKLTAKRKKNLLEEEEGIKNSRDNVLIFGAGHVGQALFQQLKNIPLNVSIIDSRPPNTLDFLLPDGCKTLAFPEAEIRNAEPGSAYVILTHDHSLDFLLAKEAIVRNDAAYIGIIGSKTKKKALISWLKKEDVFNLDKVFMPLGESIANVKALGKQPAVIASLAIAEILGTLQANRMTSSQNVKGLGA